MLLSRHRRLVALGGALFIAGGLVLLACSDNTVSPLPGVPNDDEDSGSADARTDRRNGTSGDDDDDVDGGADCGNAPRLRGVTTGFFCGPNWRRPAGGTSDASASSCDHDETCCNGGALSGGGFPPAFCAATPRATDGKGQPNNAACAAQAASFSVEWNATGAYTWECADKNSCNPGQVCCLFTKEGETDNANIGPNLDKGLAGCNAKQAFKHGGSYCATACADTDVKLCSSTDDNCGSQKCVPFRAGPGSRDLAYCN